MGYLKTLLSKSDFIKRIGTYNKKTDKNFNYLKLIEEMGELQEVLIKPMTKEKNNFSKENRIDEIGDVLVRLAFIIESEDISEEVSERIKVKLAKHKKNFASKKYKLF